MFAECYESGTRADMRREAVPDSRSSNAKGTGAKWQVGSCDGQNVSWSGS